MCRGNVMEDFEKIIEQLLRQQDPARMTEDFKNELWKRLQEKMNQENSDMNELDQVAGGRVEQEEKRTPWEF